MKLRVAEKCVPPLLAGKYTLEIQLGLRESGSTHGNKLPGDLPLLSYPFEVTGPCTQLSPDAIYSVYPPANSSGDYERTLPHITFTRRTLPWEVPFNNEDPYLALLLLPSNDECLQPSTVEDGTITLSKEALAELMLPLDKIKNTAHVRRVERTDRAQDGFLDVSDEGEGDAQESSAWLSTLVCATPVPSSGGEARELTALVVSLKDTGRAFPLFPLCGPETLTLPVLTRWSFVVEPHQASFSDLTQRLSSQVLAFSTDSELQLQLGYVPLVYNTRSGTKHMSWYRGPFVPFRPDQVRPRSYLVADAARRDDMTALPDVSYAAAWQLGRLLSLQNPQFMQAIRADRFNEAQAIPKSDQGWSQKVLELLENCAGVSVSAKPRPPGFVYCDPPIGPSLDFEHWDQVPPAAHESEAENGLGDWLARLQCLHGVPLQYLVPHPDLLPMESLRFFYLDFGWISAAVDGAASLLPFDGRRKTLVTDAAEGKFLNRILPRPFTGVASGFLLRSDIVTRWRGLGVRGEGEKNEQLDPLRIERLSPELLLCIFNGAMTSITLTEPLHLLHFAIPEGKTHGLSGFGSSVEAVSALLTQPSQWTLTLEEPQ